MKCAIYFAVALFAIAAAVDGHVKVVGEIENHKFIDRVWVSALAERNDYVYKSFTFPEVTWNLQSNVFLFTYIKNIVVVFLLERTLIFKLRDHWLPTNGGRRCTRSSYHKRRNRIKAYINDPNARARKTIGRIIRILWR